MRTGAIVLAAGASSRLGEPKQLLKFKGITLLRKIAETAIGENLQTIIVLGEKHEILKKEIEDLPLETVFNAQWQQGMSSSVKAGLLKLLEIEPQTQAVILLVCDQPLIEAATIRCLIEKQLETQKNIVASRYDETLGVPALFTRAVFDELLNLEGDKGARLLIQKYRDTDVSEIAAPEASFDIDTPEDYKKLIGE